LSSPTSTGNNPRGTNGNGNGNTNTSSNNNTGGAPAANTTTTSTTAHQGNTSGGDATTAPQGNTGGEQPAPRPTNNAATTEPAPTNNNAAAFTEDEEEARQRAANILSCLILSQNETSVLAKLAIRSFNSLEQSLVMSGMLAKLFRNDLDHVLLFSKMVIGTIMILKN